MNPDRCSTLQAVATVGNATALCILACIALNAPAIFQQAGGASLEPSVPPTHAQLHPVLFILLDGLGLDVAQDAALMPALQRLAARGRTSIARVEALIPSTVAGIRAVTEGIVIPPASFVFDFAAPRSPTGGCFALAHQRGRTFVAGPGLWRDLYGPWIDEAITTDELTPQDEPLLEAALRLVRQPGWSFGVIHFSSPDLAAHRHGGRSAEYRAAAAWCDEAVDHLAEAAGPEVTLIVSADHGVTARGGHAGPEPVVLQVPVIAAGPALPLLPNELRQAEVRRLIEAALSGEPLATLTKAPAPNSGTLSLTLRLAGVAVAWYLALALLGVEKAQPSRVQGGWLHASVWIAAVSAPFVPVVSVLAGLLLPSWIARRSLRLTPPLAACSMAGCAAAALRLWHARVSLGQQSEPCNPLRYLLLCLFSLAVGWMLGAWLARRPAVTDRPRHFEVFVGALAVLFGELALTFSGQTVSLSTLDVRLAFHLAPAGLPLAIIAAALQPFLPLLLVAGALFFSARSRRSAHLGAVAAGCGAFLLAEAAVAAAGLIVAQAAHAITWSSLCLALLARTLGAVSLLFPLLAVASRGAAEASEAAPPHGRAAPEI